MSEEVNRRELEKKMKPNGFAEAQGLFLTEKGEVVLKFADNSRNQWRAYLGQIDTSRSITLTSGGKTSVCFLMG